MVAVGLATPPPAAACGTWWNPACWVEAGLDYAWDMVKGVLKLTWDVITLDAEDAWDDFKEVAFNQICQPGLSLLTLAVSSGLEEDFDECASPPHPIEPDVLDALQHYIQSPLDSVRIHEGCNLDADVIPAQESPRDAITFGEHIYFKPRAYHPQDPSGFALLAHELTHVLQYRKGGFDDFTCQYARNACWAYGSHVRLSRAPTSIRIWSATISSGIKMPSSRRSTTARTPLTPAKRTRTVMGLGMPATAIALFGTTGRPAKRKSGT
jgi:Domain of unknown function (DUF4157)